MHTMLAHQWGVCARRCSQHRSERSHAGRAQRTFLLVSTAALLYMQGCDSQADAARARSTGLSVSASAGAHALPPDSVRRDFKKFALNLLLLPLLDDDVPARWADPSLAVDCATADVTVDGSWPDVGAPVPEIFTVRWHMDRCTSVGGNLELSGDVELKVTTTSFGYSAQVQPLGLILHAAGGVQTLTEPFSAQLAADLPVHP
jgi:hypothetical protein